jgi:hypothetical protein
MFLYSATNNNDNHLINYLISNYTKQLLVKKYMKLIELLHIKI